ncbi:MAG: SRPBCC family protein [Rhizobiaceae bacterium]|nr:SRPBCC family protein [Rhizobiaceae bacterium]
MPSRSSAAAKRTSPTPSAILHSTFSIERVYPVAIAKVFKANIDQAMKRRWFAEGEGFEVFEYSIDPRVGGREFSRFRFSDGPEIYYDGIYRDVVENSRLVLDYKMGIGDQLMSVSLATIEFVAEGNATRLVYTEQGVYFDDPDAARNREEGSRGLLEALAKELGV